MNTKSILHYKRYLLVLLSMLLVCITAVPAYAASGLEDGEYTINYEILKGDPNDDSTSLANDYWNKPATVIVKNGGITVRTTINKNEWVTAFSTKSNGSFVDAKVISESTSNDSRVVEFKVSSLDSDLSTKMSVYIPEIDYDHSYETRFRFYPDSLKLVKAAAPAATAKPEPTPAPTKKPEANNDGGSKAPAATASSDNKTAENKASNTASATAKPNATDGSASVKATSTPEAVAIEGNKEAVASTESNETAEGNTAPAQPDAEAEADTVDASSSATEQGEESEGQPAEETTETIPALESASNGEAAVSAEGEIEAGEDSKLALVIMIIVVILFVAAAVAWLVISRKRNK